MICNRCQERGKNWAGDDAECGFQFNVFSPDNWNCATLNALRTKGEPQRLRHDDESATLLAVPDGGYVLLRWYKPPSTGTRRAILPVCSL
jgi:hypothetical protein